MMVFILPLWLQSSQYTISCADTYLVVFVAAAVTHHKAAQIAEIVNHLDCSAFISIFCHLQ